MRPQSPDKHPTALLVCTLSLLERCLVPIMHALLYLKPDFGASHCAEGLANCVFLRESSAIDGICL